MSFKMCTKPLPIAFWCTTTQKQYNVLKSSIFFNSEVGLGAYKPDRDRESEQWRTKQRNKLSMHSFSRKWYGISLTNLLNIPIPNVLFVYFYKWDPLQL